MRNLLFVLILMSFGVASFCQVSATNVPTTIKFEHQKWIEFQDRKTMAFDLVDSRGLLGKTRAQVRQMLGDPYNRSGNDVDFYSFNVSDAFDISHRLPTVECLEIKYSKRDKVKTCMFSQCPFRVGHTNRREGDPIPDAN